MSQVLTLPAVQSPPLPFFSINPVLDGVTYTLQFEWNDRDLGWYLKIYDEPGQVLLAGQCRIPTDWPCYAALTVRTPPGLLTLLDTAGEGAEATLEGLGDRWQLFYTPAAEVPA